MNQVESTALWTAIARARDAARPEPVCGDVYATRFGDGLDDSLVQELLAADRPTKAIAVRHRIIDDLVRARLEATPDALVLVLGAGLDTRAYRLGAGRFVEVDQPTLLAWKEARLPASESPRPLQRVPVDFAHDALADKLAHLRTEGPVIVVAEGLFPYLPREAIEQVFATLRTLFPDHELIADVLSRKFMMRYGRRDFLTILEKHGVTLPTGPEDPRDFFEAAGYRGLEVISPITHMAKVPKVVQWFMRDLFEGNVICSGRAG